MGFNEKILHFGTTCIWITLFLPMISFASCNETLAILDGLDILSHPFSTLVGKSKDSMTWEATGLSLDFCLYGFWLLMGLFVSWRTKSIWKSFEQLILLQNYAGLLGLVVFFWVFVDPLERNLEYGFIFCMIAAHVWGWSAQLQKNHVVIATNKRNFWEPYSVVSLLCVGVFVVEYLILCWYSVLSLFKDSTTNNFQIADLGWFLLLLLGIFLPLSVWNGRYVHFNWRSDKGYTLAVLTSILLQLAFQIWLVFVIISS